MGQRRHDPALDRVEMAEASAIYHCVQTASFERHVKIIEMASAVARTLRCQPRDGRELGAAAPLNR